MATEITRNLKLRIPDGTSQDARYNLLKLDDLSSAYALNEDGSLTINARDDITILPGSQAAGGSSTGTLFFGTTDEDVSVVFYSESVKFETGFKLKDQATGGDKYLNVRYKSDVSGATDTGADRTLSLDLAGGDRTINMAGNFSITGNVLFEGGFPVTFTSVGATSLELPETGTLVTTDAVATLTNKTIVVANNTVTTQASGNLTSIELNAALAELQADIDTRAVNATFTSHTGASSGVHGVVGSVVGTTDAQTLTNKNIVSPTGIVKSDVGLGNVDNTSDATKDAATATLTNKTISGASNTITNVSLTSGVTGTLGIANGGTGQTTANTALNALLPTQTGNANYVLQTDGTDTSWAPAGSGTVTSVAISAPSEFSVSGSPVTTSGTLTLTKANQNANLVYAGPSSGGAAAPTFRALLDDDIPVGSSFAGKTTDDLSEGSTNFYYSDAQVNTLLTTKTTDDIAEGVTNLYLTSERIDDRVDALLIAGTGISKNYNDAGNSLTITNTAPDQTVVLTDGAGISVTGTYPSFTIASTITQYTDELAQDAVAAALTDTSSIDFAYNDGLNTITAVVLPAGVDHDSLQNFVANEHIDHSSVSIATSATSGLSGGGDITTTRNITVAPTNATAETPASGDIVLFADVSDSSNLKKATIQELLDLGGGKVTATWTPGDGTSKAVTHSFATNDVTFNVYDIDSGEEIWVDTATRTSTNVLTLTSSVAPSGTGWKVVIRK